MLKILMSLLGLVLLNLYIFGQEAVDEPYRITKISEKINIDGRVDESVWLTVDPFP